jgi:hypothetical protein
VKKNRRLKWMGHEVEFVFGKAMLLTLFRLAMACYLVVSAAIGIHAYLGVPVILTVLLHFGLVSIRTDKSGHSRLLTSAQATTLSYAMLLLGTGYRLAGHASVYCLAAVVVYWALVITALGRKPPVCPGNA